MYKAKLISSLEKCFKDTDFDSLRTLERAYIYPNQKISVQIAMTFEEYGISWATVTTEGIPAECITKRAVDFIPSEITGINDSDKEGFIRSKDGLYPDLLSNTPKDGYIALVGRQVRCFWIDIDFRKLGAELKPTEKKDIPVVFTVHAGEEEIKLPFTLKYLPIMLPEQEIKVTQWFHCDCLATYYGVEVFSERHWEIIENFAKAAVRNGINTLLTPIFTPPLDTVVGGERPTVQLVRVKRCQNGRYIFNFDLLDRWIDMCDRVGVKFFEISHLFTQWGAAHAPKIMADTPDGYVKIFGWETEATGPEYKKFLRRFLDAFVKHMKARGDDTRCLFHISDEPGEEHLKQYLKDRRIIESRLKGYPIIDALSEFKFYKSGAVSHPVPANTAIEPFIKQFKAEGRKDLWTYYCCGQVDGVSNRFFSMPGARTRFIGFQFWKYDIAGFLQWGFNFYFNCGSRDAVNPYLDSNGGHWVPSGDTYSVYPNVDGTALDSMRIEFFRQALDDLNALRLCEFLIGREKTLAAAEEICGDIRFSKCVCDSYVMEGLRERIDSLISSAI